MLDVFVDSIEDNNTREVIKRLVEILNQFPFLKGKWTFKEISVTAAVTNKKLAHNLGFKPKDAILLAHSGSSTVTLNYDEFDSTTIDFSTSGATTLRLIIGTYSEVL